MQQAKAIPGGELTFKQSTCQIMTLACNSTVTSTLTTDDCPLDDGTFIDFWEFPGTSGMNVTINLMSPDFDTFLFLLDPTPAVAATDDDGGTGTNSRLQYQLDSTGNWTIGANGFGPDDLGTYTISLECQGGGTGGNPPAAPSNLTAQAISTTEINLAWNDNSNNEDDFQVQIRESGGSFTTLGTVPANVTAAMVTSLDPATTYDFRVRARNANGSSAYSNVATATTQSGGGQTCVPGASTLCLDNNRFRVEVQWRDFAGNTGSGRVVPVGSEDSGLFWFFDADNWEMLIKVLNGCAINGHYWVFAAATTNVEYTIRVTDTERSEVSSYFNPLGRSAPAITDTEAFATCP